MANHRVYLFRGYKDTTVQYCKHGVCLLLLFVCSFHACLFAAAVVHMDKASQFYEKYVPQSSIKQEFREVPSEHAWVTNHWGEACDHKGAPCTAQQL